MIALVDLVIGGHTYRYASESVSVPSAGGPVVYRAGVVSDQEVARAVVVGADSDLVEVPVELVAQDLDVGALVRAGADFGSARASLSLIWHGQTWEQRLQIVSSVVSDPTYGGPGEPLAFSLSLLGDLSQVLVPGSEWVYRTGAEPHPFTLEEAAERVVPIVFGAPAWDRSYVLRRGAGSPATAVLTPAVLSSIVIAAGPVHASTVVLHYAEPPDARTPYPFDVVPVRGPIAFSEPPAAYVDLPASTWDLSDKVAFAVRWVDGYGMLRPGLDEPITTAGHLIEYLLGLTGVCDYGRTAAAVDLLPVQVDGYIDEQVEPVRWIAENLGAILPVSIANGPDGLYPIVARAYLDPSKVSGNLSTARREIQRVGPAMVENNECLNDITIRYGVDCVTREPLYSVRLCGDTTLLATRKGGLAFSPVASRSLSSRGVHAKVLTVGICHRAETAHQIASYLITRYAVPSTVITYSVRDPREWLEPGASIRIVDDELGIDSTASVEEVRVLPAETLIRVRTVPQ